MKNPDQTKLLQRLNRIEGQVRGLQRMITDEQPCVDILTQIAAVRAALAGVGRVVFEEYSRTCIQQAVEADGEGEALEDLLEALNRLLK